MTGACVNRPHREQGIAVRPSLFLRAMLSGFVAIASVSVFQYASACSGVVDGAVAAGVCLASLSLAARAWARRQPVALELHADGLTLWDRAGVARHTRISGCAQWSGRLLALTLTGAAKRPQTLLVAADSVDAETFRQLAVHARRAASAYL